MSEGDYADEEEKAVPLARTGFVERVMTQQNALWRRQEETETNKLCG